MIIWELWEILTDIKTQTVDTTSMQLGLSSTKEGNEVKVCDLCALVLLISGTRHQRWKTGDMQSSRATYLDIVANFLKHWLSCCLFHTKLFNTFWIAVFFLISQGINYIFLWPPDLSSIICLKWIFYHNQNATVTFKLLSTLKKP